VEFSKKKRIGVTFWGWRLTRESELHDFVRKTDDKTTFNQIPFWHHFQSPYHHQNCETKNQLKNERSEFSNADLHFTPSGNELISSMP